MGSDRTPGGRRGQGPREFGRDGTTGLVTHDRALRAREASRPTQGDRAEAREVVEKLLARATGRRR
ncbi:hypothetical protein [Luteococcus sp. OSA5]|uniref:hypothetical protein n=1 Tax=Luteococcus sp. OSA5 TaxID=3401630 RepID=UPI003B43746A